MALSSNIHHCASVPTYYMANFTLPNGSVVLHPTFGTNISQNFCINATAANDANENYGTNLNVCQPGKKCLHIFKDFDPSKATLNAELIHIFSQFQPPFRKGSIGRVLVLCIFTVTICYCLISNQDKILT